MATERITYEDWMDTLTAAEEASAVRARADAEAGRVLTSVTSEALEAFYTTLDHAERRRLLDSFEELRTWFATHA